MDRVISSGCIVCRSECFLPRGVWNSPFPMAATRSWWLMNAQWNQCGLQGSLKGQKGSSERTNLYPENYKKWLKVFGSLLTSYHLTLLYFHHCTNTF